MAEIVRMPKLSDTMTDGVIAKWHKKVGDKVKSGELLADIETDKATMEFESFQDGVLLHIGVQEKEAVPVDSIIAILGKQGEDVSEILKKEGGSSAKKSDATNGVAKKEEKKHSETKSEGEKKPLPPGVEVVRMPKLSDTMSEGVVAKWHKNVGDKVKSGEVLADIETDKATMEFESFQDGVLLYRGIEEGKGAAVDSILAILGKGGENIDEILASVSSDGKSANTEEKKSSEGKREEKQSDSSESSKKQSHEPTEEKPSSDERIKASPLAKALAKDKGIDISLVKGTGDNGRITKADIENYKPSSAGKSQPLSVTPGKESYTDEAVSQMRKTIARRLLESKNGAPHFYLNIDVDMDNAIASRTAINNIPDTKISFNDIVIKACAAALRKHPKVSGIL